MTTLLKPDGFGLDRSLCEQVNCKPRVNVSQASAGHRETLNVQVAAVPCLLRGSIHFPVVGVIQAEAAVPPHSRGCRFSSTSSGTNTRTAGFFAWPWNAGPDPFAARAPPVLEVTAPGGGRILASTGKLAG